MEEINELAKLKDSEINRAKEILAFEVTKVVHDETEAKNAQAAAKALFQGGANMGSIPTTELPSADFENGINVIDLLERVKLIPSRSEGRRLVQQGGLKIADKKIDAIDHTITTDHFDENKSLLIQKGKKVFHVVKLV